MLIACLLLIVFRNIAEAKDILLAMPGVKPNKEDQYLCHGLNVNNGTYFITGFEPKADAQHAHHVLIYGCLEPGSTEDAWNCQEMTNKKDSGDNIRPVCKEGTALIYSWAMNAPGLNLPPDVSFMVGKGSDKPYLVLQAHYKNVDAFKKPDSPLDRSGINLKIQSNPTKKLAGLYIIATDGSIPGHSTVFMEAACSYDGKATLHPFAFRTHTHKLGQLVSGYVIHNKQWIEIGKKSPQLEQTFYPVTQTIVITPGDTLAGRCVMKNDGDKLVKIGSTRQDEMCNFYFMYWIDKKNINQLSDQRNQVCFSQGWPDFKWSEMLDPLGIPDSASMLPGETKMLKEILNDVKKEEKEFDNVFSNMLKKDLAEDVDRERNNYEDAMNFNIEDFNLENGYF